MPKTRSTASPDSELGRIIQALRDIRKGEDGLTESAVAESAVTNLPLIQAEARRLNRSPERIAVALIVCLIRRLAPSQQRAVTVAYATVDYVGWPGNATTRRAWYCQHGGGPAQQSTAISHENKGFDTIARRLLDMRDPVAECGDYLEEARLPLLPPEVVPDATSVEERHHPDEVRILYEESWYLLQGRMVRRVITFLTVEARIEGVTGITHPHYGLPGTRVGDINVLFGGAAGRVFLSEAPVMPDGTNVDFFAPLRRRDRANILLSIPLEPTVERAHNGVATIESSETAGCRMRVQFDPGDVPLSAEAFMSDPVFLPQPLSSKTPLPITATSSVEYFFPRPDRGLACAIGWQWANENKDAAVNAQA
jgi:hypothetical protein